MVESERNVNGVVSIQQRYYILSMESVFTGSLNLLEVIGVLKINCIGFLMLGLMKMLLNVVEAILLKI